jgi:hypothetical protein
MYTKDSALHVWLIRPLDTVSPDMNGSGEHLAQWLTDMLEPSSTWDSVKP